MNYIIPEDCTLIAHDTGNGWALEVDKNGDIICILKWPSQWPSKIAKDTLIEYGFKIV